MDYKKTDAWNDKIAQQTFWQLPMTTELFDENEPLIQCLVSAECFDAPTMCALAIYLHDDIEALHEIKEEFPRPSQELIDIFYTAEYKGSNAYFKMDNYAPLKVRMADLIDQVNLKFDRDDIKDKEVQEDIESTADSILVISRKIELCQSWLPMPPKLLKGFCTAMEDLAELVMDHEYKLDLRYSCKELRQGQRNNISPAAAYNLDKRKPFTLN